MSPLSAEQVSTMKEIFIKESSIYSQEQAIVFQQPEIASTIPDSLYLKIKGKPTVKEAWDALKADFEKRSRMITIELRKQLHDIHCTENGNIRINIFSNGIPDILLIYLIDSHGPGFQRNFTTSGMEQVSSLGL